MLLGLRVETARVGRDDYDDHIRDFRDAVGATGGSFLRENNHVRPVDKVIRQPNVDLNCDVADRIGREKRPDLNRDLRDDPLVPE